MKIIEWMWVFMVVLSIQWIAFMGQNNQKVVLGGTLIKIILVIKNSIYFSLVYLKRHPSNYLITNGKYPIYHILFNER
jgi:hypothetical protein